MPGCRLAPFLPFDDAAVEVDNAKSALCKLCRCIGTALPAAAIYSNRFILFEFVYGTFGEVMLHYINVLDAVCSDVPIVKFLRRAYVYELNSVGGNGFCKLINVYGPEFLLPATA